MTAIVSVDFDWSIESCDKAPRDLDYERNTEKYGRAMKLTIAPNRFWPNQAVFLLLLESVSSLHITVFNHMPWAKNVI